MRTLVALIICFVAFGYSQNRSPETVQYFPPLTFNSKPDRDAFVVKWYSQHLTAMREPSLWEISKSSKQQIYRFLWLRSFHAPIMVRLNVNPDGTGVLTTKITNGKGGYEAGRLTKNRSIKLPNDEIYWFLDMIEELKYWQLSTTEEEPNMVPVDGAQWIIEAVKDGNYKIVDRWSPEKGPVRVIGLRMLLDLAKLKLLFEEVY